MAKPLSVLLVTSEVYPFLKTSELADIIYAHSLGTREVGHDMRVMMPKYGFLSERKNRIHDINRLKDMPISVGDVVSLATVKSSSINNARVKVQSYITTNSNYLDARKGVMADNTTGKEFPDNDERFIFYNRTVLETCMLLGWFPDIIHCVGWQAAMVPALLRTQYATEFKKTRILMTISDFDQQGVFGIKSVAKTGLPDAAREAATYNGKMNFLRLGLTYADGVSTLSPAYKNQLMNNPEFTENWLPLIGKKPFVGIPHGVDLLQWTPKADAYVKPKFDANDLSNKSSAREALQKMMGLKVDGSLMVASYCGPLTEALGADLLLAAIPELIKKNIQVVIGSDIPYALSKPLAALAKKNPLFVAYKNALEEEQLHHMLAGSTLWLKPSRSEATGQFQRAALAYGTIPVVRNTGGVADALKDVDMAKGAGNAYVFNADTSDALIEAITRAQSAHAQHELWNGIVTNAMSTPIGWTLSALPYDELYRSLVKDVK